jgi:hypothetical protein
MNESNLYLLILEKDLRLSESIRTHLQQTLPQVTPLLARTVAEANVFVYQYQFHAYLIDLSSSEDEAMEFIVDLKTVIPEAKIVIMSTVSHEILDRHLRHLGQYDFVDKAVDIFSLEDKIRPLLPQPAQDELFRGSLRQMRLVDLIQVKCLGHDRCQLVITGPSGHHGMIVIGDGQILNAQTNTLAGNEALVDILGWKRGFFHETDFSGQIEINIRGSWEMVLMEAVRRSDESCALEMV